MRYRKFIAAASLLLLMVAGCGDLNVTNLNDPEAKRALANPGDVESLIVGAWNSWWVMTYHYYGAGPWLSTTSFQHSAYPANFAMVHYSAIPRVPTTNDPAHAFYDQLANPYGWAFEGIAAANDGLRAIFAGSVDLGDDAIRAEAFARFAQGLGYGYLAMLYDRAPIVDETTDLTQPVEFVGYDDVLDAALGYLDEAIAIASANQFEIPASWIYTGAARDQDWLVEYMHSYKARLRAAVARTPAERAAVNWQAVLDDVGDGVTSDVDFVFTGGGYQWAPALYYTLLSGWSQMNYMVHGMADQSGKYQEWMALGIDARHPDLPSGAFLMDTPDTRFPQGATLADQQANPGTRMIVPATPGAQWGRPDRGTWRWSYYRDVRQPVPTAYVGSAPDVTVAEMRLLEAEARFRLGGQMDAVAQLINVTRVAAGLNATDAAGTNTSCVPKLPSGTCGGLFEMLKWEKRMEAAHNVGHMIAPWYFDSRGWGDLMQGTILQLPIPATYAELASEPIVDYGSSFDFGAPVGTYGY